MRRSHLLSALVGGVVAVVVGGVAWAAIPPVPGGVIQGCYDSGGNVKVVEALPCPPRHTPFQWNQLGPQGIQGPQGAPGKDGVNGTNGTNGTNGADGVSVTSESEPAGANCTNGGSKFTASNGVTYACNGTNGTNGTNGQDGVNGVSGYEIVTGTIFDFPPGAHSQRAIGCPAGKKAISGGVSAGLNGVVTLSRPDTDSAGQIWLAAIKNTSASETTATQLWAVCADVGSLSEMRYAARRFGW